LTQDEAPQNKSWFRNWHLPKYNFCGPFTDIYGQIKAGKGPINKLDQFCFEHDVAYSYDKSKEGRKIYDSKLAEQSENLYRSKETSAKEKFDSFLVSKAMKLKGMLGLGHGKRRRRRGGKRRKMPGKRKFSGKHSINVPQTGDGLFNILKTIANMTNIGTGIVTAYKIIRNMIASKKLDNGSSIKVGGSLYLRKKPRGNGYLLRICKIKRKGGKKRKRSKKRH
jgi:hypothetical protein